MLANGLPYLDERQVVHRLFSIRWTAGCVHTRLHGAVADDRDTRAQIEAWAAMLQEVLAQVGGEYVSIIDASALGPIPRGLMRELVELTRSMIRKPERRALVTAEGGPGDDQAEAAQLVTAGNVRAFRPDQREPMIAWLSAAGTLEARALAEFLS